MQGQALVASVEQSTSVDFNVDPPACTGDPDMCGSFSYDKSGTTADQWKAVFDLAGRKLVIRPGAKVSMANVPATSNNRGAPGIEIRSSCGLSIDAGATVSVASMNQPAGGILIRADGDVRIDGLVRNSVSGTNGTPGKITIASCLGDLVTGPVSRIETLGVDHGGQDINLLTCELGGNISVGGMVHARHKYGTPPSINVVSFGGSVTIDGRNDFGEEVESGTTIRRTSGLLSRTINATLAGSVRVQAKGDVNVLGNRILHKNRVQFGAIAVKPNSTNGQGGDGAIFVRSLEGRVIASDRALDFTNRFNALNEVSVQAAGDIELSVNSSKDDCVATNTKPVVSVQGGPGGSGGTNALRSFAGRIQVGSKAQILANVNGSGATGTNQLTACTGVSNSGVVTPPDSNHANDSGVCTPAGPAPLFTGCEEFGVFPSGPQNRPPSADAGPDQTLTLPAAANLDGAVTDDGLPSGGSLTASWTKLSGPGVVTFSTPTAANTPASFSLPGNYVLRLVAFDSELQASDDVAITVVPGNGPPTVDVGPDRIVNLPSNSVALSGLVGDDGLPANGSLSVLWSQVSGPASAVFTNPVASTTTADLPAVGVYVLRLSASDGALAAFDDLQIEVAPAPGLSVSVGSASVPEGSGGTVHAMVPVTLSEPPAVPVSVDYYTSDGTAGACDYATRFGTLTFEPGVTTQLVDVPVFGDFAPETAETVNVQIGNPVRATLGNAAALLTIQDDDGDNQAPLQPVALVPTEGTTGSTPTPILAWFAADPDAGDVLTQDVHFGTTFSLDGQAWARSCPATSGPSMRSGAATTMDDASDRLILFGGQAADGTTLGDTWVLENASGLAGTPRWVSLAPQGPSPAPRQGATAAYDPASNHLIVHGGCEGACAGAFSDTWVLTHANGLGGLAEWQEIASAPLARTGHVAAYDPKRNTLLVFGGSEGSSDRDDAWVLSDANGLGTSQWHERLAAGLHPPARRDAAGGYDSDSDRLVVFGGRDASDAVRADVWVLAHALSGSPEWLEATPAGGPVARYGHAAAYDAAAKRLVVFGGTNAGVASETNFVFADTWLLDNADLTTIATPQWHHVDLPEGPAARFGPASAYSEAAKRLIVTLGGNNKSGASPLNDLWALADAPGRLPLVSANQTPTSYAAGTLTPDTTYFWRVVSRDQRQAAAASHTSRFTPGLLRISVEDVSVLEGDAGQTQAVFTLTLSRASESDISVHYATADATAKAGSDYLPRSGPITFAAGQLAASLAVPVLGDTQHELREEFRLLLGDATGGTLARSEASASIEDDDGQPNAAPLVNAGPDQAVTSGDAVLSGSVVDDGQPQGTTVASRWSVVSGPGVTTFATATASTTTVRFSASGSYVLRLTADDGDLTGSDDVSISVALQNRAPVVDVGSDLSTDTVSPLTLSGVVVDDGLPAGSVPTILWSQLSGPGTATLANATARTTSVGFPVAGSYIVRLTASDGELSASDTLTVNVATGNRPPSIISAPVVLYALSSSVVSGVVLNAVIRDFRASHSDFEEGGDAVIPGLLAPLLGADGLPVLSPYSQIHINAHIASEASFNEWYRDVDGVNLRTIKPLVLAETFPGSGIFQYGSDAYFPIDNELFGNEGRSHNFHFTQQIHTTFTYHGGEVFQFTGDDDVWVFIDRRLAVDIGGTHNPASRSVNLDAFGLTVGNTYDFDLFSTERQTSGSNFNIRTGVALEPTRLYLYPVAATDPDLDPLTYSLSVFPQGMTIDAATGRVQWNPGSGQGGLHSVTVTVNDGRGGVANQSFTIQVIPPTANQPPSASAGPDSEVALPASGLLSGVVVDDGLPSPGALIASWSLVTGPGLVTFANPNSATTTASFSEPGTYVLRLLAADTQFAASDETVVVVAAAVNAPPTVDAGADQTILLPDNASLFGGVSDDSLPPHRAVTTVWSLVTGPGPVVFTDATAASTDAGFVLPGNYVLRLTADDGELAAQDEVELTVLSSGGPNAAPLVDAGTDRSVRIGANLLENPGNEAAVSLGLLPGWTQFSGDWTGPTPEPPALLGTRYFYSELSDTAELRQDVDVQAFASGISTGALAFAFEGYLLSADELANFSGALFAPDEARFILEYRDAVGSVIGRLDSGPQTAQSGWRRLEVTRPAPTGTTNIRVRLLVNRAGGFANDAYWDAVSLRAIGHAAVMLHGRVRDDGLPGVGVTTAWSQVAGPAAAAFSGPGQAESGVVFTVPGEYQFRLTANDDLLSAEDEVTIAVLPGDQNEAPVVSAGADRDLELPEHSLTLVGTASDDGLPAGNSLVTGWSQVSGPAEVEFGLPEGLSTSAIFPSEGTYVLRLGANDGDRVASDEMSVIVRAFTPENEPPVVDAGPSRVLTLPNDSVILAGTVTDDGLPAAGTLVTAWTLSEGPSPVVFSAQDQPLATARFTAAGSYRLRLTASDGEYTVFTETFVSVAPEGATNAAPSVSAGPPSVLLQPASSLTLVGQASDDGRPTGSHLSVAWSQDSGPALVAFASPAQLTTTATLLAVGTYVLRLSANDGVLTSTSTVTIQVLPPNQAPIVAAGPDLSVPLPPGTVALSGTASDDGLPSASGLTRLWSQVSGPGTVTFGNAAASVTSATFPLTGLYTLRLTASDAVLTASDDVIVSVVTGNAPPAANAGSDQVITLPTTSVALVGAGSDDGLPTGSTLTFAWTQVGGPAAAEFSSPNSAATTATFEATGTYVLRLAVSDGVQSASDDMTVNVQGGMPVGAPPTVAIASPVDGQVVTAPIDVVGSITADSLLGWKLKARLVDDANFFTIATGVSPQSGVLTRFDPTLLLNGQYEVVLRATDTSGRVATASFTAVVRDNFKVGNFTVSFNDLEIPMAGMPIRVTRTYDSRDKRVGDFGYGWRVDVSNARLQENGSAGLAWAGTKTPGFFSTYCLEASRLPLVTITTPDGRVHEFEPVLQPACSAFTPVLVTSYGFRPRPESTTLGTLQVLGENRVIPVGSWPGEMQLFSEAGYELFDPDTYLLTLPDGRQFTVHQQRGLTKIRDLNGNELSVTANGITHSSGIGVAFTRDAQGRITRVTDPAGDALDYGYDASGDLVSFTDREENPTTFSYVSGLPHLLERIQDPFGRTPIRNEFDASGRITRHTDAFGKTIEYTHDLNARQEIVKDRNDKIRVLDYDTRGNVVKETQPDERIIRRGFDARNNRTSETEPHEATNLTPATTSYLFDSSDNLLSTTDPLGGTTEYSYNSRQQVLTARDARGKVTANVYDARGNLLSTIDPGSATTSYGYDARGNALSQTVSLAGVPQTTQYGYDIVGNLTSETDAIGHVTTYTYDGQGNRLTQMTVRTTPLGPETLTTNYEYDKNGRLTRTTDPDGSSTRTVYDAMAWQVEAYDKLGRRTSFEYDEMGHLTKTTYPDLTTEESSYDPEGRRLTSRDRAGRPTSYQYDDLGRLTRTTYADLSFTENTYDAAGRLVATKDARGKTANYEYDAAGRRTKLRDPLGNETVFTYDSNGNQRTVRDARLNTIAYEYDDLNRRTRTIFPDATFMETSYDELGRRVSEKDQAGRATQFRYDALGRLASVIDALHQETVFAYDEVGNRISQTDAKNHTTAFQYDRLGREVRRTLPDGSFETKSYDTAGNLETRTDFMDRVTSYGYDDNNRLLSRRYPNAAENVSFTYSATGRRQTATDNRGTTSYGYDLHDRLTSLVQPGVGSLSFAYDGNGNRTALTPTIGGADYPTTYTYDDASRLDIVVDPFGRAYDYGYDPNGNRVSLAYPNATATTYTYNTLNRLTNLTTAGPLGIVFSQAFTLGPSGNRTQIVENDGTIKAYGYDALYRLSSEAVTIGALTQYTKAFGYDAVGNRQTQTTAGSGAPGTPTAPGTVPYAYDTRDRLLTDATSYAYDANGNLTTKTGEANYTWDHENRLVRVTKVDGTLVETAYDVDGNRVSTTTTLAGGDATTVGYLVDTSGGLSHVVAETGGTEVAPTVTSLYVRGADDLLSVIRPNGGGGSGTSRFFHADGIGSIRRLTGEGGIITDGYSYTAFGELVSHTGTDPQPYAFAGEPYDPNVGFQYHRARWMDPRAGRLVGMDPWAGNPYDPPSLHRYLYATADPLNKVDPSGRESLGTQLTTISTAVTVFLSNFGATLANAFRQGGPVLGEFFQNIGRFAQGRAVDVVRAFQNANPQLLVEEARVAGPRVIDLFVRFGQRAAYIEVKWGLPWRLGESMTRLTAQVDAAIAAGEGEVVVWAMRLPTSGQINLVVRQLGQNGARVQFVYGVDGWIQWMRNFVM